MYKYSTNLAIEMVQLEKELTARKIQFDPGDDEYTIILQDVMPQDLSTKYGVYLEN